MLWWRAIAGWCPRERPLECHTLAPLAGDHTTAHSGTLWRNTLRLMLARAKSDGEVPLYTQLDLG